jgi:hypothetical protein
VYSGHVDLQPADPGQPKRTLAAGESVQVTKSGVTAPAAAGRAQTVESSTTGSLVTLCGCVVLLLVPIVTIFVLVRRSGRKAVPVAPAQNQSAYIAPAGLQAPYLHVPGPSSALPRLFCSNCGSPLDPSARFCGVCGQQVGS